MIDIFGKQMFGECAEQWLKLCKEQKKEWILKNTSQTDESIIDEFVSNPKISKECKCLDCGKSKQDGNISESISTETTTNVIDNDATKPSRSRNTKRRTSNKGT